MRESDINFPSRNGNPSNRHSSNPNTKNIPGGSHDNNEENAASSSNKVFFSNVSRN